MYAFGIGKQVITVVNERGICEARREVEPGVFKGWVKPVVEDNALKPGEILDHYDFRIRKSDVVRVWVGRPGDAAENRAARAAAYPLLGDQLDAIMKGFAALKASGVALAPETERWVNSCLAVKADHPL